MTEGAQPTGNRRVLVAEDNVYVARSLGMVLELWGFEVTVAYDGPGALAAARELRPAAVLLDMKLPKLDGLEVARRIRREPELASILLLALTGSSDDRDRSLALEAGVDHHLVKPVDPTRLRELLLQPRPGALRTGAPML